MKIWERYKNYLLTGEWHIHTKYTDGKNSVLEICKKAVKVKIPLVAFTEHVRKQLTYDFSEFLNDIENAREQFPELIILSGIEAKVLPDGTLDVSKGIIKTVDYPIFAFHSFPEDRELYINCLKKVVRNRYVNTWAHPGLFLERTGFNIGSDTLRDIFHLMQKNHVLLEINKKYSLPSRNWINLASKVGVITVRGSDVHKVEDLEVEL